MNEAINKIQAIESQIEDALHAHEMHSDLDNALWAYQLAETELLGLTIITGSSEFPEQQRVLSYCLMRQGNILRQMGKPQEARSLSEREIAAARLSGDSITLARSLMSNGTNLLVTGELETGLKLIEESRQLFELGVSYDHKQGLGWYWILQADLAEAGLIKKEPTEATQFATRALEILKPIENWPGVARAYATRAKAYEKMGEKEKAANDRKEQKRYEEMIGAD